MCKQIGQCQAVDGIFLKLRYSFIDSPPLAEAAGDRFGEGTQNARFVLASGSARGCPCAAGSTSRGSAWVSWETALIMHGLLGSSVKEAQESGPCFSVEDFLGWVGNSE